MIIQRTTPSDLDEIFRIRLHPAVSEWQFNLNKNDTIEYWRQSLSETEQKTGRRFESSTVWFENKIVGHVSQYYEFDGNSHRVQLGFNLNPAYWGRGIMRLALEQVIANISDDASVSSIAAGYFRNNERCKRLLVRLGFVKRRLPLQYRLRVAYENRCLKWIEYRWLFPSQQRVAEGKRVQRKDPLPL